MSVGPMVQCPHYPKTAGGPASLERRPQFSSAFISLSREIVSAALVGSGGGVTGESITRTTDKVKLRQTNCGPHQTPKISSFIISHRFDFVSTGIGDWR